MRGAGLRVIPLRACVDRVPRARRDVWPHPRLWDCKRAPVGGVGARLGAAWWSGGGGTGGVDAAARVGGAGAALGWAGRKLARRSEVGSGLGRWETAPAGWAARGGVEWRAGSPPGRRRSPTAAAHWVLAWNGHTSRPRGLPPTASVGQWGVEVVAPQHSPRPSGGGGLVGTGAPRPFLPGRTSTLWRHGTAATGRYPPFFSLLRSRQGVARFLLQPRHPHTPVSS